MTTSFAVYPSLKDASASFIEDIEALEMQQR